MDGACEQRRDFKENGRKDSYTQKRKDKFGCFVKNNEKRLGEFDN